MHSIDVHCTLKYNKINKNELMQKILANISNYKNKHYFFDQQNGIHTV